VLEAPPHARPNHGESLDCRDITDQLGDVACASELAPQAGQREWRATEPMEQQHAHPEVTRASALDIQSPTPMDRDPGAFGQQS